MIPTGCSFNLDGSTLYLGFASLAIAQAPATLDFGHTFVALDPDGHRLRVFAPGA